MPLGQRKRYCLAALVIVSLSLNYHGGQAWEPPKEDNPDKTEGETSRGCPEYLPSLTLLGSSPTTPIKTSQQSPIVVFEINHLKRPQTLSVTVTSTDNRQIFVKSQKNLRTDGRVSFHLPKLSTNEKYTLRASIPCQGSSLKGVRLSSPLWIVSSPEKTSYDQLVENYKNASKLVIIESE